MTGEERTVATSTEDDRSDYIARAWNEAYERAYPPGTSYDKAEQAGRAAAIEWDRLHARKEG